MNKLDMKKNERPGILITFCGLDGCGKTTMMNMLISYLKDSHDIFVTKQPTNAVRNSDIFRTYMDSPIHDDYDYRSLSLLAASDRLQHVNKVINPKLEQGTIILSDRYFYSCLANLRARGFESDRWIYDVAQHITKPDIAFFFDTEVDTAISRVRSRPEEKDRYIDVPLQYKLRAEYIDICKTNNGVLIQTNTSPEESFLAVKQNVERLLETWKTKKE